MKMKNKLPKKKWLQRISPEESKMRRASRALWNRCLTRSDTPQVDAHMARGIASGSEALKALDGEDVHTLVRTVSQHGTSKPYSELVQLNALNEMTMKCDWQARIAAEVIRRHKGKKKKSADAKLSVDKNVA